MALVFFTSILLVACSLGKALVLPATEEAVDAQSLPAIRTGRCQEDFMQNIRKTILESLNLQSEPHITFLGMTQMREQFKTAFRSSGHTNPEQPKMTGNTTSSDDSRSGNLTAIKCCKFASQIFIKDLGWDNWIIYPESFSYIHCSACDIHLPTPCREESASNSDTSQMPCCRPTVHKFMPFFYLDKRSTLTIASVQLTHECGCRPEDIPHEP